MCTLIYLIITLNTILEKLLMYDNLWYIHISVFNYIESKGQRLFDKVLLEIFLFHITGGYSVKMSHKKNQKRPLKSLSKIYWNVICKWTRVVKIGEINKLAAQWSGKGSVTYVYAIGNETSTILL